MYVLYNKHLKRYFKHPKVGIWWTHDLDEAQQLLETTKEFTKSIGLPEICSGLIVQEISDDISEIEKEEMLV